MVVEIFTNSVWIPLKAHPVLSGWLNRKHFIDFIKRSPSNVVLEFHGCKLKKSVNTK